MGRLFRTFILVLMLNFASWRGMLFKDMAKCAAWRVGEQGTKREQRRSVNEQQRWSAEEEKKDIQGENEWESCLQTTQVLCSSLQLDESFLVQIWSCDSGYVEPQLCISNLYTAWKSRSDMNLFLHKAACYPVIFVPWNMQFLHLALIKSCRDQNKEPCLSSLFSALWF